MALPTLDSAMIAVPQLRSSCILIFADKEDTPGLGIKLLRLVSKQLRNAMLGAVRGYTLQLDGSGFCLPNHMALLRNASLSCLRVYVTAATNAGDLSAGLAGWDAHELHLSCCIHGMGAAMRSVTRLEVVVQPDLANSSDDVARMLSQLACACPSLQQLQVTGEIGRAFLAALGVSCSRLSGLEVMLGVSCEGMQDLHLILPSLTECRLEAIHMRVGFDDLSPTRPCCLLLLTCTTLVSLDVGTNELTDAMWQALPASLKELCCSTVRNVPEIGYTNNVTKFKCMCYPGANVVYLGCLVRVLRLMPHLKVLMLSNDGFCSNAASISEVCTKCAARIIPDMKYLHDLASTGLVITSQQCSSLTAGRTFPGFLLGLSVDDDDDDQGVEIEDIVEFLSLLPLFPAFTGLGISSHSFQPSFASLTEKIQAVFPHLKALSLDLPGSWISNKDLRHLGSFKDLQHLFLDEAHVSPAMLGMLCVELPQLKMLLIRECPEFTRANMESLEKMLSDWGSAAKVSLVLEHS